MKVENSFHSKNIRSSRKDKIYNEYSICVSIPKRITRMIDAIFLSNGNHNKTTQIFDNLKRFFEYLNPFFFNKKIL